MEKERVRVGGMIARREAVRVYMCNRADPPLSLPRSYQSLDLDYLNNLLSGKIWAWADAISSG